MGMGYANGSAPETCQLSESVQLSADGPGILNVVQENISLSGGDMKFLRHCICFCLAGGSAVQKKETASIEFQHNRSQFTFILAELGAHMVIDSFDIRESIQVLPEGLHNLNICHLHQKSPNSRIHFRVACWLHGKVKQEFLTSIMNSPGDTFAEGAMWKDRKRQWPFNLEEFSC